MLSGKGNFMHMNIQRMIARFDFISMLMAVVICIAINQPAVSRAEDTAASSPYSIGLNFFLNGEYSQAIATLSAGTTPGAAWLNERLVVIPETAQDEAAAAACLLGDLYALGLGTPRDMAAAGKWWFPPEKKHDELLAAAEKGDISAQTELGDLYLALPCAVNIDPDHVDTTSSNRPLVGKLAFEWYAKAAAGGSGGAAIKAAKLVETNFHRTPLEQRSIQQLYRIAADSGLPEGQYRYGLSLRDAKEYAEGLRWIRMAEAQGYAPAKKYLEEGRARELRDGGGFEMVVVLAGMIACLLAVFLLRKKKPLRDYLTRRTAVKAVLYIAMLGFSLASIAMTPELSRLFDRIFFYIMRARIYLPDSVADNVYIFVTAIFLALIALILVVAQFKDIFFRSMIRALDTEPESAKPPEDKKPD